MKIPALADIVLNVVSVGFKANWESLTSLQRPFLGSCQ